MDWTEYIEAWIDACRQALANPYMSLALLRMGIADPKQALLWFDLFWIKREMSEKDWSELRRFITEAFNLWLSCRTTLVICREGINGTVTFNSGAGHLSDSTKGLIEKAYYQALSELRSVV